MSDNDEKRHWHVDDAYDDLLNSYFTEPEKKETVKHNTVEKTPQHKQVKKSAPTAEKPTAVKKPSVPEKTTAKKPGEFKLEIKNLDNEFNAPPKKTSAPKRAATGGVPKAQLYKKAEPGKIKPEKPVRHSRTQQSDNLGDTIDFLPAFSYERPAKPDGEVKPQYREEPVKSQAPKKRLVKKPKKSEPEYVQHNADGTAVIIKKNNMPAQKRIIEFFNQNKKAWIIIAVCIACAVIFSTYTISCMNDILAIHRDSENVVTINVPADTDTKGAIDLLRDNGLIKHKVFCTIFAKAMSYRDDNYLTGIYYLTGSMGLENMLSTFKEPTITGETVTLTFPEGNSVDQIAEKLEKYEVCSKTAFYTTMRDIDFSSEYTFIAEATNKDLRYHILEGYLYPDTYEFFVGENASSVIRKFLDNFKEKWTDEYAAQAQKMGMSVDDVIRLASILEKEAYGADQMPQVSSVLHNRLDKSGLYPTLQCDSTTAYINDYIAKNVTDSSALSKYTQNYSTYKCEGLPVGAICNPGNDAIHGALFPANTNYYFFLHDNNKKLYLAANDAEHRANGIAALKANSASNS